MLTLQEYGSILSVSEPSSSYLRYQMLIDTNRVRMRAAWFYTDDLSDDRNASCDRRLRVLVPDERSVGQHQRTLPRQAK